MTEKSHFQPEQVPCCFGCWMETGHSIPKEWDNDDEEFFCQKHDRDKVRPVAQP